MAYLPHGTPVLVDGHHRATIINNGSGGTKPGYVVVRYTDIPKTEGVDLNRITKPHPEASTSDDIDVARVLAGLSHSEAPTPHEIAAAAHTLLQFRELNVPSVMEAVLALYTTPSNLVDIASGVDENQLIQVSTAADEELEPDGTLSLLLKPEEDTRDERSGACEIPTGTPIDVDGYESDATYRSTYGEKPQVPVLHGLTEKLQAFAEGKEDEDEEDETEAMDTRSIPAPLRASTRASMPPRRYADQVEKLTRFTRKPNFRVPIHQPLVAATPQVDRSNHLHGISATSGQITGNYGQVYKQHFYDKVDIPKQCWICGLGIYCSNEYEHVQPFKTALFECLLYIPAIQLEHDSDGYKIARQCIGEYSHASCNGGGTGTGRRGKGDFRLKKGGRNGNWDDLEVDMDAVRILLIGANNDGTDAACIWQQLTESQRNFFENDPRLFFSIRGPIVAGRTGLVVAAVKECVDWKTHALIKSLALTLVTAGIDVKPKLLELLRKTSALSPKYDPAKFQPQMYMQPSGKPREFGEAFKMLNHKLPDTLIGGKTLHKFKTALFSDFDASYGSLVTGVKIDSYIKMVNELIPPAAARRGEPPPRPRPVKSKPDSEELKRARAAQAARNLDNQRKIEWQSKRQLKRGGTRKSRRVCTSCGHQSKHWKTQRKPRRPDDEHQVEVEIVAL